MRFRQQKNKTSTSKNETEKKGQKHAADRGVLAFKTRLKKRTKSKPLPENDHHKGCKKRAKKATTTCAITISYKKAWKRTGGLPPPEMAIS